MRRTAVVIASGVLAWCAGLAAADPEFRLIAVDAAGAPRIQSVVDVRGETAKAPLPADAFRLLEDGAPTVTASRTLKFRDTGMPVSIIVAVDMSQSMRGGPLTAIRNGIAQLVSRKREGDRVALLSFADEMRWEARWDASESDLRAAFQKLDVRGNRTRLYDAVWESLDEFDARADNDPQFPARRLILVISDGHDEGSGNTLEQVAARLRDSRVRVDAVGLARSPAWLKNLELLVDAGFGNYRATSSAPDLTALLEQGIEHVLDSPVLEFTSANLRADGTSHRVGLRHGPSNWSGDIALVLPQGERLGGRAVWIAAGSATAAVAGLLLLVAMRRRRASAPIPVVSPSHAIPLPESSALPAQPPSRAVAGPQTATQPVAELSGRAGRSQPAPPRIPAVAPTVLVPRGVATGKPVVLAFTAGPYAGQRFSLSDATVWIGSNPNNQLVLSADPGVSGHHACISREGAFYRLHDNGSLNRTWVNGRSINSDPVLLRTGDHIRIGGSECTFAS